MICLLRDFQDEPGGKIRMMETDVATDLLHVKIRHLSFEPRILKPAQTRIAWVKTEVAPSFLTSTDGRGYGHVLLSQSRYLASSPTQVLVNTSVCATQC
jgi:hypothetical protein